MRFVVVCGVMIVTAVAVGSMQAAGPSEQPAESLLALQYDFSLIDGGQVADLSGSGHDGRVLQGEAVYGWRRMALQFANGGHVILDPVPERLKPRGRAMAVGAWARPAAADGVLVSMGGRQNGFSLYLRSGVPHFAVRSAGELAGVAAPEPVTLDQWVHLIGVIDGDGRLSVLVGGWPVVTGPGRAIAGEPGEPFMVGADAQTPVGEYSGPQHWRGQVEDVRLYWGSLSQDEIKDWLNLAGCGCRSAK
jgi:hypothetical protein